MIVYAATIWTSQADQLPVHQPTSTSKYDALSTGLDNLSTLRVSAGQTWLLLQQLLQ